MSKFLKIGIIRKEKDGYHIYSEKKDKSGRRKHLGGPYSKEKALKRLRQIEFFKKKKSTNQEVNIMKSFLDLGKVVKLSYKLEHMLDPESKKRLQEISMQMFLDKIPDYDPKEPLPSSFSIPKEFDDELVHKILKAIIKYPNIRTNIRGIEFKIWKTKSGRIMDQIVNKNIDPTDYYNKHFLEKLFLTDEDVEKMLNRQIDFVTDIKNKKAHLIELMKTAKLLNEIENKHLPKFGFTESVGLRVLRQSLNTASRALKELKTKFKSGDLKDMPTSFDVAIHSLSLAKSIASSKFEKDSPKQKKFIGISIKIDKDEKDNEQKDKQKLIESIINPTEYVSEENLEESIGLKN